MKILFNINVIILLVVVVNSLNEQEKVCTENTKENCDSNIPNDGTVVITGANKGIGLETIIQLAKGQHFSKYILTVRSNEKGENAIKLASEASAQPISKFSYVLLDLEDTASVMDAVSILPDKIDALIMNAGGLGIGNEMTKDRVTRDFAKNTLGHVTLLEGLLSKNKISLSGGTRIIFSGSEMARPVWAMTGFQAWPVIEKGKLATYMHSPPMQGTWGISVRIMHAVYGSAKTIGGLWLSQLAKERKNIYFATVSPGGSLDTDAMKDSVQPLRAIASNPIMGSMFRLMRAVHSKEDCAKRYVAALTENEFPNKFPSGSVIGSPASLFPFYIGAAGPLTNQKEIYPIFDDSELQREAARAVRAKVTEAIARVNAKEI